MDWKLYFILIIIIIIFILVSVGVSVLISVIFNYPKIKNQKNKRPDVSKDINMKWIITRDEMRIRKKRILRNFMIITILVTFNFILKYFPEGKNIAFSEWVVIFFILISIYLTVAFLYFHFNQEIAYDVNSEGIMIKKNNKEIFFSWDDFEYFSSRLYNNKKNSNNDISGEVFYIKIRSRDLLTLLINRVLCIRVESDNKEEMYSILAKVLPENNSIEVPSFTITKVI